MGRQHPLKNWEHEVHQRGMADPDDRPLAGPASGPSNTSSTSRFFPQLRQP
jgi:hypothetical protein